MKHFQEKRITEKKKGNSYRNVQPITVLSIRCPISDLIISCHIDDDNDDEYCNHHFDAPRHVWNERRRWWTSSILRIRRQGMNGLTWSWEFRPSPVHPPPPRGQELQDERQVRNVGQQSKFEKIDRMDSSENVIDCHLSPRRPMHGRLRIPLQFSLLSCLEDNEQFESQRQRFSEQRQLLLSELFSSAQIPTTQKQRPSKANHKIADFMMSMWRRIWASLNIQKGSVDWLLETIGDLSSSCQGYVRGFQSSYDDNNGCLINLSSPFFCLVSRWWTDVWIAIQTSDCHFTHDRFHWELHRLSFKSRAGFRYLVGSDRSADWQNGFYVCFFSYIFLVLVWRKRLWWVLGTAPCSSSSSRFYAYYCK